MQTNHLNTLRIYSVLLTVIYVVTQFGLLVTADTSETFTSAFVTRLYEVCLDRSPDEGGFAYWTNKLTYKTGTGVSVAYGFVYSTEFQSKGLSDEDYVNYMYVIFFDREPDTNGYNNWINRLGCGMNRDDLFFGFANSVEFYNLCSRYGVIPGTFHITGDQSRNIFIDLFVYRMYEILLNRKSDMDGLGYWSNQLYYGYRSGSEILYGFLWSEEYLNQKKSDSDFIEDLYKSMFGRNSDSTGKTYWINRLNQNWTRKQVFNGFVGSSEFCNLCQSYGIPVGGLTEVNDNDVIYTDTDSVDSVDLDVLASERGYTKYEIETIDGMVTVFAEFVNMDALSDMVNDYRITLGLAPYKVVRNNSYARLRAVEAAYYFSHNSPNLRNHNWDAPNMSQGENCCTGINPQNVYNTYYRSLGHRLEWEAFRERTDDLPANYRRHIAVCSIGVRLYRVNDYGTDFVRMTSQDCMSHADGVYGNTYGRGFGSVQEFWEIDNLWNAVSWEDTQNAYRNCGVSFRIPDEASINPGLSTSN